MVRGLLLVVSHLDCLLEYSNSFELHVGRSQWPYGLRCGSAVACLLGLWVWISQGPWMSVLSVVCCQVEVCVTGWSLVQRSPRLCCLLSKSIDVIWIKMSSKNCISFWLITQNFVLKWIESVIASDSLVVYFIPLYRSDPPQVISETETRTVCTVYKQY
jgi:hypothetical protein